MNPEIWYTEYNHDELEKKSVAFSMRIDSYLVNDKSEFQKIDIVDTKEFGRLLLLDGLVMLTEKDEHVYHDMMAHVPANHLLYNNIKAENVLVIGGGDGGTVREFLKQPHIRKVTLCEIDGKVVDYSKKYFPQVAGSLEDERVEVVIGDGIEYIKKFENEFDVISIDSTDPIGPAVGLFNEEFYRSVYRALKDHGVFSAQQESYVYYSNHMVKMNAMLKKVFPHIGFFKADIPTYPSGTWCFALGSKKYDPLTTCRQSDFPEKITYKGPYYNSRVHQAAFALPTAVLSLINN